MAGCTSALEHLEDMHAALYAFRIIHGITVCYSTNVSLHKRLTARR